MKSIFDYFVLSLRSLRCYVVIHIPCSSTVNWVYATIINLIAEKTATFYGVFYGLPRWQLGIVSRPQNRCKFNLIFFKYYLRQFRMHYEYALSFGIQFVCISCKYILSCLLSITCVGWEHIYKKRWWWQGHVASGMWQGTAIGNHVEFDAALEPDNKQTKRQHQQQQQQCKAPKNIVVFPIYFIYS